MIPGASIGAGDGRTISAYWLPVTSAAHNICSQRLNRTQSVNFRRLKTGRWQARIWKDGKYESIGTFRTKKEAELAAGKAEEKVYYGYALNDRKKHFKDLADEWLNLHKKTI
ncbi:hypothetical protein [Siminovitchia fordii]|uniref:hypothetical protein n=1 Tax=Siminovitchia fordii TaxID=254759 RepID=UPI00035C7C01|nr:hypothetical protein [Siminovitchia fordii]